MKDKKILYIDMDGVIVDFERSVKEKKADYGFVYLTSYEDHPDLIPKVFIDARPINGALPAIKKLLDSGKYEMYLATTAPWGNPTAMNEKLLWVKQWLGNDFHKKLITTHRKDLLMGDYLIDDRVKNGAGEFKGELISFGYDYENKKQNEYPDWDSVLKILL